MKKHALTIPEIGLIGGTRVALGIGLGLLLANRLSVDARRATGSAMLLVGLLTTPPLIAQVLGRSDGSTARGRRALIGDEDDPRERSRHTRDRLQETIESLRAEVQEVDEPQFKALLETSAEVLSGLSASLRHYAERSESAWRI